jgi:hypothetical protein
VKEGNISPYGLYLFFVFYLTYSSTLKMEDICASEALFFDLYGFTA